MAEDIDEKPLHLRRKDRLQRRGQRRGIHPVALLQRPEGGLGGFGKRGIGRVVAELLAHDIRDGPAGGGGKDQPAGCGKAVHRGQGDQTALAMAQGDDAARALGARQPVADDLRPGQQVVAIGRDGDVIGIADGLGRAEHAAFVDADRGDAAFRQGLRQQRIGRRPDAKRRIAVAVGRPRSGQDQQNRHLIGQRPIGQGHRSRQRALRAGGGDLGLDGQGLSSHGLRDLEAQDQGRAARQPWHAIGANSVHRRRLPDQERLSWRGAAVARFIPGQALHHQGCRILR